MTYASPAKLARPITLHTLYGHKKAGEKFAVVALYDAPLARLAEQAGVEVLLVGDSLGMTVSGYASTLPVTLEHMVYHVEAVSRGSENAFIIGDLPFMSYATPEQALSSAARVMQAGAHMVKLEGGDWLVPTVKLLAERGIPVCAHLGLTPQSVNKFGGFRVQGREQEQAERIYRDALSLEQAGADALVLECIPNALGERITHALSIPTIGIGAGATTDAQVLVVTDVLGITPQPPKFAKNFLAESGSIAGALGQFAEAVKAGEFPDEAHAFR